MHCFFQFKSVSKIIVLDYSLFQTRIREESFIIAMLWKDYLKNQARTSMFSIKKKEQRMLDSTTKRAQKRKKREKRVQHK